MSSLAQAAVNNQLPGLTRRRVKIPYNTIATRQLPANRDLAAAATALKIQQDQFDKTQALQDKYQKAQKQEAIKGNAIQAGNLGLQFGSTTKTGQAMFDAAGDKIASLAGAAKDYVFGSPTAIEKGANLATTAAVDANLAPAALEMTKNAAGQFVTADAALTPAVQQAIQQVGVEAGKNALAAGASETAATQIAQQAALQAPELFSTQATAEALQQSVQQGAQAAVQGTSAPVAALMPYTMPVTIGGMAPTVANLIREDATENIGHNISLGLIKNGATAAKVGSVATGAGAGAATGAAIGAWGGPIGAGLGAVLGGLGSLIFGDK
ncbi:MAG: hypothetical protein ABFD76_05205 [Smithella sp.]